MLEREKFLEIKELAQKVRSENENLFDAFKMEAPEDAIKEKEEFVETVIDSMEGIFSDGENGKEEKQIFRANVLIPDDDEFFDTYSKDKNIRNLMNTYSVGIEDVMSKITELNIYADYLADDKKGKSVEKPNAKKSIIHKKKKEEDDFVDAMVNLSSNDAESLLDEIEHLSNSMEGFNITDDNNEVADQQSNINKDLDDVSNIEMSKEENSENEKTEEPHEELDYSSDMSIEDISEAVNGFVDDYNSIQIDLDNVKQELKNNKDLVSEQKKQIQSLREEAYSLRKNNLESVKSLKDARKENNRLENENTMLSQQVKDLEDKLKRSSALLQKIYNSIPRK